jgi:hypothetical protein
MEGAKRLRGAVEQQWQMIRVQAGGRQGHERGEARLCNLLVEHIVPRFIELWRHVHLQILPCSAQHSLRSQLRIRTISANAEGGNDAMSR